MQETELQRIDSAEFATLTRPLLGMPVTHPWRGYGSALFLELGPVKRIRRLRRPGHSLKGRVTIMIQWSWRVERPRSIAFGSWSTENKIDSGIPTLKRAVIEAISLDGNRLPELILDLTEKRRLRSMMTSDGQPEWSVRLPDDSWLFVKRGVVNRRLPSQPDSG